MEALELRGTNMGHRKWPKSLACGVGGGVLCVLSLRVRSAWGWDVQFPVFAGDEDFAYRTMWFALLLLPGSVAAGMWLGAKAAHNGWAVILTGFGGACTASVAWFGALYAMRQLLWKLPSRNIGNAAAVGAMLVWLAAAVVGAALAGRAASILMCRRAADE